MWRDLLTDPKLWWALYSLALAIVNQIWPDLPANIMTAIEAVVGVIIAGLTVKSVQAKARARALARGK